MILKNENSLILEKIKSFKEQIEQLSKETKSKLDIQKRIGEKKQEEKNLNVVISQKSSLEKDITKIEKILTSIQNKITEFGVKYGNADKIISNVAEINDCPTCHQKVTSEYKKDIIHSEKAKMKKLKELKKEYDDRLLGYEERLSKSKENLRNVIEKEKEIERVKVEIENLEKSIKGI